MREEKKLFDKLKYSIVMPIHQMNYYTDKAIKSNLNAIGDRKDIEFLILDDCAQPLVFPDKIIKHIKLPRMDLINKLIMGTQFAQGEYYCNADYDDIAHPKKFEYFDKLLETNDLAGANSCIFCDALRGKTYKPKNSMRERTHNGMKFPWLQHSNSAIPLEWLRKVGYGSNQKIGMVHKKGHVMTDSPIWAQAQMQGLKFGFFEDIDQNAWKECWQIITEKNVNQYTPEMWKANFVEVKVEKPEVLR